MRATPGSRPSSSRWAHHSPSSPSTRTGTATSSRTSARNAASAPGGLPSSWRPNSPRRATPMRRRPPSTTARATSAGRQRGSSRGRRRSARSQTRSLPSRPAIAMSPRNQRMSSIRPSAFPSFQPPVRHCTAARSSRSAREERPAPPQLAEDVPAERRVRREPLADVPRPRRGRRADSGAWTRGGSRSPSSGRCAPSTRTARLARAPPSSSATSYGPSRLKSTMRSARRRPRRGRPARSRARGRPRSRSPAPAVQELRRDREPARLRDGQLDHRGRTGRAPDRRGASRSSARSSASSSACRRGRPARGGTRGRRARRVARSDLRSARPTIRSRQRSGST